MKKGIYWIVKTVPKDNREFARQTTCNEKHIDEYTIPNNEIDRVIELLNSIDSQIVYKVQK